MLSQPPPPEDAAPFGGIKIFLHVRTSNDMGDKTKHDAKKAIKKLGGSLTVNLEDARFVVFHNGSEALLQNALAKGKPVLKPQFLVDCKNANAFVSIEREHFVNPDHFNASFNDSVRGEASRKRARGPESSKPYLDDGDGETTVATPQHVASPLPNTQTLSDVLDVIVRPPQQNVKSNSSSNTGDKRNVNVTSEPNVVIQPTMRPDVIPEKPMQQPDELRPIRIKPERVTITGPEEEKGFLRDIIVGFGVEFELKVFGRVKKPTHYVVLSDAITPKILLARITGAPMLTREWVTDSLTFGGFVEPLPRHYHPLFIEPVTRSASNASPPKSKVVRDLERHRLELSGVAAKRGSFYATLLASKTFYLLGTSENPTNEVYAELLRLMGASIARSFPSEHELTAVIEVDGGLARNTKLQQHQRDQLRANTLVSTAWIVETASTGVVAPFEPFSVLPDAASQSLKALLGGLTPLAKTKQGPSSAAKVHSR
ncbi:Hypothetical protein, putative [Bodo saltans]|uniref:BRCT domain-containing protein n=1 Tax=Bodo saltans TaxID=75058 RepID=A0A0S4ITA2_BODSA|nr:Hypothetical protein, putative [Bodo saltans]|eukprot:CUE73986.1 Hypothetical protein, putative [Bodo saltans]